MQFDIHKAIELTANSSSPSHYLNLAVFSRVTISRKGINQQTPQVWCPFVAYLC
jgi:hypothetical protein